MKSENRLFVAYCRLYEAVLRALSKFIHYPENELKEGVGSLSETAAILKKKGFFHPLFVVDGFLHEKGLDEPLLDSFEKEGMSYATYLVPKGEPGFDTANECYLAAKKENVDCIVAYGGGSAMDVAKGASVLLSYRGKDLKRFAGLLKIHRRLPYMLFVPTTAGTGSEVTPCAVLALPKGRGKVALMSPRLISACAILDGKAVSSLDARTASYGMLDALTHAVESYLNAPKDRQVRRDATSALRAIFLEGEKYCKDRSDLERNQRILKASYLAGRAFGRGYVGYSHAISHAIGGSYHLPHGLLNAILLPRVLKAYGKKAVPSLSRLEEAIMGEIKGSEEEKAASFVKAIEELEGRLAIPTRLPIDGISMEEALRLAREAHREASPLYHVPRILSEEEIASLILEAGGEK